MKLLLDTHVFLWFRNAPDKLPEHVLACYENIDNDIFLSMASVWEMQIKNQLGKLEQGLSRDRLDGEAQMLEQRFHFLDALEAYRALGVDDRVDDHCVFLVQLFQGRGAPLEAGAVRVGQIGDDAAVDQDDSHQSSRVKAMMSSVLIVSLAVLWAVRKRLAFLG